MDWREFLKVYIPSLIAFVFIPAFASVDGGWAQMSGGHTGFKALVSVVGYLGGIAIFLIISSFGIGAVLWLTVFAFKTERPSYLHSVKNTLFVLGALLIIGSFYDVAKQWENSAAPEEEGRTSVSVELPEKENEENKREEDENINGEGRIIIRNAKKGDNVETWNETALWEMSIENELVKWISKDETVNVIEGGGSHYKVEHEGDIGYVSKENIKPKNRE